MPQLHQISIKLYEEYESLFRELFTHYDAMYDTSMERPPLKSLYLQNLLANISQTFRSQSCLTKLDLTFQALLLSRPSNEFSLRCLWASQRNGWTRLLKTDIGEEKSSQRAAAEHSNLPDAKQFTKAVIDEIQKYETHYEIDRKVRNAPDLKQMLREIHAFDRTNRIPRIISADMEYVHYSGLSCDLHANIFSLGLDQKAEHLVAASSMAIGTAKNAIQAVAADLKYIIGEFAERYREIAVEHILMRDEIFERPAI